VDFARDGHIAFFDQRSAVFASAKALGLENAVKG
jgi:hypothetical protein